eukprot:6206537-Pleurochrysis_carterae.AAC.1
MAQADKTRERSTLTIDERERHDDDTEAKQRKGQIPSHTADSFGEREIAEACAQARSKHS